MLTKPQSQSDNNKTKINDLYVLTPPLDVNEKVIIDIQDIMDYCFCSNYYELKNKSDNETSIEELYDFSIHKTFYMYLLALQENKLENTMEFLKYKWGKEWIKYKKKSELFVINNADRNNTYETYRKKGIDTIFKFNDIMISDKQCPIVIGHKYQIEILPNIILTGTFEYIRELTVKDQKLIQLVKFIPNTVSNNTNVARKFSLDLIAMSYAFKELFNVTDFQVVSMEINRKRILINNYSDKEYNMLKDIVKSTVIAIQNNIKCFSPSPKCIYCHYRNICAKTL